MAARSEKMVLEGYIARLLLCRKCLKGEIIWEDF